jgi:polysaccharide chain length determinant protein (PEP-CTERM system associated)
MDQLVEQVLATLRGMWRRRWYGVLAAWIAAVVGAVIVTRIADRYEAEARVYVDTKSVLRPLMRDLAVEPDLDQTIGMLGRILVTRPNVEGLITRAQLLPSDATQSDRDGMVEALLRNIKVTAVSRDNVFSFSYRDTNPEVAQRVVRELVSLFVESDLGNKQRDVEGARNFIEEQVRQYEGRLSEAEGRLKEFKLRHLGTLEGQGKGGDYFARIAALREEMNRQALDLRAAEQARDSLKNELSGEVATLVPDQEPIAPTSTTSEYDARLDAQRRQLDELLRRYTEAHPDVISTRRLIARLEEQREQDIEAQRKAAAAKPARSKGGNTVMQQVKLALAEAEANVASLKVRLGEAQTRLAQMTAAANRVPQIDAELAQLNRDYDVVRRQYEAMVARREKASLSEDVDATRLAQFRIIDPPRVAPRPVFPNRASLVLATLLVALAAGAGAAFLATQVMPTFDTAAALRQLTQRPVLGSVSKLADPASLSQARRGSFAFGGALGSLIVVFAAWLAWISMLSRA